MTNPIHQHLLKTQELLRLVETLDDRERLRLQLVKVELELIEFILTEAVDIPKAQFRQAVLDACDDILRSASHRILEIIRHGGRDES